MRITPYPVVSLDKVEEQRLIDRTKIVFITATPVEQEEFYRYLQPIAEYEGIVKVNRKPQTYHVGVFGRYIVAHTQTAMGAVGRNSSQNVTTDSIGDLNPRAIIMTGIAFGLHRKNKRFGDVLVSSKISQYEVSRIGATETEWRGDTLLAGVTLLNRFSSDLDWEFPIKFGKRLVPSRAIVGTVLSGEKLVDNADYVKMLEKEFPKAIGGEMEGAGVASACERKKVEWIVVKGICDWGDGKKDKKFQATAAKAATDLAYHILSEERAFEDFALEMPAPPIDDQLEFSFSAARGTALWALNRLRTDALSEFIVDLEGFNDGGIPANIDSAVRLDLAAVIRATLDIPVTIQEGKLIVDRMREFKRRYVAWADIAGANDAAEAQRREAILKLRKARQGLGDSIRRNSFLLGVALRRGPIHQAISEQRLLVESHIRWFPNLARALERIRSRSGDAFA